ncbi:MAG: hypothetical protein WA265_03595, partial [Rhodomicrobium sp.]
VSSKNAHTSVFFVGYIFIQQQSIGCFRKGFSDLIEVEPAGTTIVLMLFHDVNPQEKPQGPSHSRLANFQRLAAAPARDQP